MFTRSCFALLPLSTLLLLISTFSSTTAAPYSLQPRLLSNLLERSQTGSSLVSRAKHHHANTEMASCVQNAGMKVITSSWNTSDVFWTASQANNLVYHYHPEAIAYPTSTQNVQDAVLCAAKHGNVAVAARGGGHSFGGFGSGGQDGSLIIDLSEMDSITSDPSTDSAEFGPGVRLGDVIKGLWKGGKRATPHGTCPAVGAGHFLCGGFGPTSRMWGLAADNILEADVVLANGQLVTASSSQNQELFWALKGAGSFFGIVTRFKFRTYPADVPMTFLEYRWTPSLKGPSTISDLIEGIQNFANLKDLPAELGFHIQLQAAHFGDPQPGNLAFHMRGMYAGPQKDYEAYIPKLWKELEKVGAPPPDRQDIHEASYFHLMEEWDDFGKDGDKLDTMAERLMHNNFVAKTQLTMGQRGFSSKGLKEPTEYVWDLANHLTGGNGIRWGWNVYLELYGGPNARHRDADLAKASSFPHRDALWLIQSTIGTWGDHVIDQNAHEAATGLDKVWSDALRTDKIEMRSYSCYVDPAISGDWKTLYYGDSIPRLEKLKSQYDPTNLFRNPQSLNVENQVGNTVLNQLAFQSDVHPLP